MLCAGVPPKPPPSTCTLFPAAIKSFSFEDRSWNKEFIPTNELCQWVAPLSLSFIQEHIEVRESLE